MASSLLLTLLLPIAAVSHMVELTPKVLMKVGDRREVTCSMTSCQESLELKWTPLQDKPLYATIKNHGRESVLIFANVTKNHEIDIICTATCGKEKKQKTTAIQVYSFPRNPVISGNDRLILGKANLLTCEVSSVYPSEYLEVELLYGDNVLKGKKVESGKDSLSYSYTFVPSSEDDGKAITCRASLDVEDIPTNEMTKETSGLMRVLSAPHNVRVSEPTTLLLGSMLNLTCEAKGNPKPVFTWTAIKPDGQSVEVGKHQELFIQNVSLSDAGTYQCGVSNDLGKEKANVSVVIQAPPMNTIIEASPQGVLKEGESVSISCLSNGVPVTRMVLSRVVDNKETELKAFDGAETSIKLTSVKLADSGIYICQAFNEYGNQTTTLSLTVETPPRNMTVEVFPSTKVQEGQNITICCHSVSFPPSAVVLSKLESETNIYSPNGVFHLFNLTLNDTGLYQVNVTNNLGFETEVFTINVMEKRFNPSSGWNDFITPAVCLGAAATLLIVVAYLRRAEKKGSYNFTKFNQGTV
ncbi:vascular cell adhesion protein 1-like [Xyrauchen texanus]|uniref:vascular cell adhesion protein 1-like n=1 Tax=Xyrauchen texanus TaxID=154827 RepID=UPI00224292BF|nr:vascular cell adhesion protein 1-like [Xyrauchen texanus]